MREETCCRHIGYSFRLIVRVILYAPSHRQDSTYQSLCYTSRGAMAGTTETSTVQKLKVTTELPSQKVILTLTENKKQLIDIICNELMRDVSFHRDHIQNPKLVITPQDITPTEISNGGVIINRRDMDTSHEEEDIITVQQMFIVASISLVS